MRLHRDARIRPRTALFAVQCSSSQEVQLYCSIVAVYGGPAPRPGAQLTPGYRLLERGGEGVAMVEREDGSGSCLFMRYEV